MPKLSVLMPIYNTEEAHLREAIDSILAQTYTDFEYLIVNDSPENTKLDSIVHSYKDPRVKYFKNDKNLGLEASTNKLIEMSQGEYVAIFDHDDISTPDRLEKQVQYLDSNQDVGLCSAQFQVFGSENWTSNNPIDDNDIKQQLERISCVSHSAAMLRKEVLINNNIRYEKSFFPAASYRMITQVALVSSVHNLPDILLMYRMGDSNTSLLHQDRRARARKRISTDYTKKRNELEVKRLFEFDEVTSVGVNASQANTRYYKAKRGNQSFFVKSGEYSFSVEYNYLKEVYSKNNKLFLKPINYYDGEVNYLVTEWYEDGVDLDAYLKRKEITNKQKNKIIDDLCSILEVLRQTGVVHRDIIPRNFMVSGERLVLIDFYWAIKWGDYREYDFIQDDIRHLRLLGEGFAMGVYKWDDAHSFVMIAESIISEDGSNNKVIAKMKSYIGERVVSPDTSLFDKTITKQVSLNDELYGTVNKLRDQNINLESLNVELRAQNSELQAQNSILLRQKREILGSSSWLITKPIRLLVRLFRKLANISPPSQ